MMKKVRVFQRANRPGWHISWREWDADNILRERKRSFPTKGLAQHYANIMYHKLNFEVFHSQIDWPWPELVYEYESYYDVRQLTQNAKYEALLTLRHFEASMGQLSSKHITQRVIDAYIIHRAESVSQHTINKDISNLRAFIRWGQKKHYLDRELEINKVKATPRIPVSLKPSQVKRLLDSAKQRSDAWYIRALLAITTGLQAGDIDNFQVGDIDFETYTAITRSHTTRKVMPAIPIHSYIIPILVEYVGNLPAGQVKLLKDTNTHKKWKVIRERAGLPNLRFHDLRFQNLRSVFSNASQQEDMPLSAVQSLLEHSSTDLTQRTTTESGKVKEQPKEAQPQGDAGQNEWYISKNIQKFGFDNKLKWEFYFSDKNAIVNAKLKGLALIEHLIRHKNNEYTPLELLKAVRQREESETEPEQIYTPKVIEQIKKAIKGLEGREKSSVDQQEKEKFRREIEESKRELKRARNYKGNSRKFSEKYTKSVSRNIDLVLDQISPQNVELYNHLNTFLKRGEICSYKPDTEIFWEII